MPNGGSDCCGTCWFNRSNKGEAGHGKGDPSLAAVCEIRDFAIESPYYTYCANHPRRAPERARIPIGPVLVDHGHGREVWRASSDGPAIREHLLARLADIKQSPRSEYPIGASLEVTVVRQLGEFGETRAIPDLERITRFPPQSRAQGPFAQNREGLIAGVSAPWVLFEGGSWVTLDDGGSGSDLVARAEARLDALPSSGGESERVRRLGHTEGWVVGDPGCGVLTFVHPLEFKRTPPRDSDVADHAHYKRKRDAQQRRVIHIAGP